ncbi:MAG: dTDP-4-dehydrorhamnose reductase [Thalassospira sp.]|uniref:dTDP-4-dehydrorhamnose reductase n=1 Tax=Thalassospira sp. TaxID=1912094 RepID=UPI003A8BACF7
MTRILVFGKTGQLARCLAEAGQASPEFEMTFLDRAACDLSHPASVADVVNQWQPDAIINAAAYTAVDQAEADYHLAHTINGEAVGHVAIAARELSIPLIHVSTDYVFNGEGSAPYQETETPRPINAYGESKLAGEIAIGEIAPQHVILRTSWVYSPYGKNFVRTMLRLMASKYELNVVDDQIGCPTSAGHLADAILRILPDSPASDRNVTGTYHLTSPDAMSWCAFARRIQVAAIEAWGTDWSGADCKITPVGSDAFPTIAERPRYSALSTKLFSETFGFELPSVDEGLRSVIARMNRSDFDA